LPSDTVEADLLPFCPFPDFLRYVLHAEYVFYWNVFSASILARLALNRPVFFFDQGHMARLIAPLYDAGVQLHFGGKEPTYLDPTGLLEPDDLERQWACAGLGNRELLQVWADASPSPQQLLQRLAEGQPGAERPPTDSRQGVSLEAESADALVKRAETLAARGQAESA